MQRSPQGTKRAVLAGSVLVDAAYALVILAACISSGYACGSWLGKTLAVAVGADPTSWGDWCGIYGGLIGIGLAGGILIARFG